MIRLGILGASRIAPPALIAPAKARDDVALQAVAARDPERARAYAREHGIAEVADSYEALVAREDVDLIYNGLPASEHPALTILALKSGKAVLSEKPFCLDARQARQMVEAATASGRPLIEAYHYRYHPVIRRAEALIREGAIGAPIRAEANFLAPIARTPGELRWERRLGGGALMDLGCYPLHALRTLLGAEPRVVSAEAVFEHGVDASLSADLDFAGVPARIATSMVSQSRGATLTIEGDAGSLEIVNFIAPQIGCRFTLRRGGKPEALDVSGPATYAAQLDHVLAVMAGREAPLTGGEDAVRQMEAIDSLYAAARRPAA